MNISKIDGPLNTGHIGAIGYIWAPIDINRQIPFLVMAGISACHLRPALGSQSNHRPFSETLKRRSTIQPQTGWHCGSRGLGDGCLRDSGGRKKDYREVLDWSGWSEVYSEEIDWVYVWRVYVWEDGGCDQRLLPVLRTRIPPRPVYRSSGTLCIGTLNS